MDYELGVWTPCMREQRARGSDGANREIGTGDHDAWKTDAWDNSVASDVPAETFHG